jgi:hypothetical protein
MPAEPKRPHRPVHSVIDPIDPILKETFAKDKAYLESTELPIVTVSSTYQEDLKGLHGLSESDRSIDIVLSRAHYSMALAVAVTAWGKTINPKKAWVVDPTNYVSHKEWAKVAITEWVGKTLARHPLLKLVKDFIDKFGRGALPILKSITPPLLYLTKDIKKPILSMHIAAGNILVAAGKEVVQVVTDPHVREDYLTYGDRPNLRYCVFDSATKQELLEKATHLGKYVDPRHVIVTGPPVDSRVRAAHIGKGAWQYNEKKPLRLCLSTGGLGTNKTEIETIVKALLPQLKKQANHQDIGPIPRVELLVYAGTQWDIKESVMKLATDAGVMCLGVSGTDPAQFKIKKTLLAMVTGSRTHYNVSRLPQLTVLYHPQIVDANELLVQHAFPWADGFITKPSGDMAYDAAAAGCFLLTLAEWGEWEHNVREIFTRQGIATKADAFHLPEQLAILAQQGWFTTAMQAAQNLGPEFTQGSKHIIEVATGKKS